MAENNPKLCKRDNLQIEENYQTPQLDKYRENRD